VGHKLRSSGLLRLKASWPRIFQFASKLVEKQRCVVHLASSQKSCEDEAEDGYVDAMGCIELFYPYFIVFVVLIPRGILIFWMGL
jgi:hypothetical protein